MSKNGNQAQEADKNARINPNSAKRQTQKAKPDEATKSVKANLARRRNKARLSASTRKNERNPHKYRPCRDADFIYVCARILSHHMPSVVFLQVRARAVSLHQAAVARVFPHRADRAFLRGGAIFLDLFLLCAGTEPCSLAQKAR